LLSPQCYPDQWHREGHLCFGGRWRPLRGSRLPEQGSDSQAIRAVVNRRKTRAKTIPRDRERIEVISPIGPSRELWSGRWLRTGRWRAQEFRKVASSRRLLAGRKRSAG